MRFYIIPMEHSTIFRGPKYFHWMFGASMLPELMGLHYSLVDYGALDVAVLAVEVTPEQHAVLAAQSDVITIPQNIDNQIGAALTDVRNRMEAISIPAAWVQSTHTYRQVLRAVTGIFLYAQYVTALTGGAPIKPQEANLDVLVRDIPGDASAVNAWIQNPTEPFDTSLLEGNTRGAMVYAAAKFGFDYTSITGTTPLRTALRVMGTSWTIPIKFGNLAEL